MNHKEASKMLSVLGHESRLHIYKLLLKEGEAGIAAGMISDILKIPVSTLSFHLTLMTNAKILTFERNGRVLTYSALPCLEKLKKYIEE